MQGAFEFFALLYTVLTWWSNCDITRVSIKEVYVMDQFVSIRPSKDPRTNYKQLSEMAKENPVAITVNGRDDTVLIGHKRYIQQQQRMQELEQLLALYDELSEGEEDVKNGNTHTIEEAHSILKERIKNFKI